MDERPIIFVTQRFVSKSFDLEDLNTPKCQNIQLVNNVKK